MEGDPESFNIPLEFDEPGLSYVSTIDMDYGEDERKGGHSEQDEEDDEPMAQLVCFCLYFLFASPCTVKTSAPQCKLNFVN